MECIITLSKEHTVKLHVGKIVLWQERFPSVVCEIEDYRKQLPSAGVLVTIFTFYPMQGVQRVPLSSLQEVKQ